MRRQSGFTLIELVMVTVLLGILGGIFGRILLQTFSVYRTSQNITETDWQGFLALERLTNDVHTIRSASGITTTSASSFAFTDINGASVTYSLSGSTLLRNSQTLASGVTGLSFAYQNNAGIAATGTAVRYVIPSITLTQGNVSTVFTTTIGTRGMP